MKLLLEQHHFPQIESTNDWSKANIAHMHPERLTVVTAGRQSAGRGRQERKWISPPDVNLYATYTLFMTSGRQDIQNIPQIIILAAVEVINSLEFKARIKWPNDIVIGSKKLGGVLCETTPIHDKVAVITGLGLNINMSKEGLGKIGKEATSLLNEKGEPMNLIAITESLHKAIQAALDVYLEKGFATFLPKFRKLLVHKIGDTVQFHHGDKILQGSFHSINDNGTLNLILNDKVQSFASGEVV